MGDHLITFVQAMFMSEASNVSAKVFDGWRVGQRMLHLRATFLPPSFEMCAVSVCVVHVFFSFPFVGRICLCSKKL